MSLLTLGITGNTDRGGAISYLLDTYTGATVGYALHKLSSTATNCIRIRRSSDNTEQDIGFVGEDLDTAAISSFVGSNSAYIKTWYDQSGNGNNLTQTTNSKQPRIVNVGTLDIRNALPAMVLDGSDDNMAFVTSIDASVGLSVFMVGQRRIDSVWGQQIGTNNNSTYAPWCYAPANSDVYGGISDGGYVNSSSSYNTANHEIVTFIYDATTSLKCWVNGSSIPMGTFNSLSNTTNFTEYGSRSANNEYFDGWGQVLIMYASSQTTNRASIETALNDYYGVF